MVIIDNNNKYRYMNNHWEGFIEEDGHVEENTWYYVRNNERIVELNKYLRIEKLKRILDEN